MMDWGSTKALEGVVKEFKTRLNEGVDAKGKLLEDIRDGINNLVIPEIRSETVLRPYPPRLNFRLLRRTWDEPYWLSEDGKVLWGRRGSSLIQSFDDWETTVDVAEFPASIQGIRELADGELLVSIGRDTDNDVNPRLFKSVGYDREDPEGTQFEEVLVADSPAYFSNHWGMSVYNEIVVVSQYGSRGVALYAYLSTDHGETWTRIFDLENEDIEGRPPFTTDAHIHSIAYDPWWHRIWICCGDMANTAIYYSEDMGESWRHVPGSTPGPQATGIMPMEDVVLFGSDSSTNGIYGIRRTDKLDTPHYEVLHRVNDAGRITYVYNLPFRRSYAKNMPVFFAAPYDHPTVPGPSVITMTVDGKHFYDHFSTEPFIRSGGSRGYNYVLGPTATGKIVALMQAPEGSETNTPWIMVADAPVWA